LGQAEEIFGDDVENASCNLRMLMYTYDKLSDMTTLSYHKYDNTVLLKICNRVNTRADSSVKSALSEDETRGNMTHLEDEKYVRYFSRKVGKGRDRLEHIDAGTRTILKWMLKKRDLSG
jgi:hypothetical protein